MTPHARGRTLSTVLLIATTLFCCPLPLLAATEDQPTDKPTEVGILPASAYDSNLGVGAGVLFDVARYHDDFRPYRWRLAGQAFVYLNHRPGAGMRVPYQNHYVKLDLPGLGDGRLRLRLKAGFRRQINAGYYGIGNASLALDPWEAIDKEQEPEAWAQARRYHEYDRTYPSLRAELRLSLPRNLFVAAASSVTWNWVEVFPGSHLDKDVREAGSGAPVLVGLRRHGVFESSVVLARDTRDDETSPSRGVFDEISLRGGPLLEIEGGYGGVNITLRRFVPLYGEHLVLALRAMSDLLFGDVPFYEQARFGGTSPDEGPGGGMSVRGVPAQRYHGKIKLIFNAELRAQLFRIGKKTRVGLVGFCDLGRVWADWTRRPDLDGRQVGLKPGLGGGLRLQFSRTFVIRVDGAWSPDDTGVYVDVGQIF